MSSMSYRIVCQMHIVGGGVFPSFEIKIAKLFHFMKKSSNHPIHPWIPWVDLSASQNVDEELKLYKFLDLDG